MQMKLLVYLICCASFTRSSNNETVDYYVSLINSEIIRAHTYPLPQDSSAFRPISNTTSVYGTFDYIIVGAGSAGAVIANRLSEIEDNHILLLEAGGDENDFSDIPGMGGYLLGLEFNWNYNTTPQSNACLGMINRECAYPRGKGLGGSSIINALIYARGNKRDYDGWADQGNPGWSYDEVLSYFKKSEDSHIDGDEGYHGENGNLNVEYHRPYSPQFYAFIEANLELGRSVVDYNGEEQLGVARIQLNTIEGRRHSAGKAFLQEIKNRSNLELLTNSLATKILIHPQTKEAYGIKFSHRGKLLTAMATKEVIISAGSFGSPQLLMLSGIGPKKHLKNFDIPVIQALAVGDNLQEHAAYHALNFNTNYSEPVKTLEENVRGYLNNFGTFTVPGNVQGVGFFKTKNIGTVGYPDIEIIMVPANSSSTYREKKFHYTDETIDAAFANVDPIKAFRLTVALLHPKSRGTVRLKSSDAYQYPLIDPELLSDPNGEDIESLYQGIQLALEIAKTDAFKSLNSTLVESTLPACRHHEYLSREYWHCQLRQLSSHLHHPSGTCKMGPDPLKGAVVNHELKVHGIRNLRVADASIIPDITSGHTHAPAVMIGEKVSDMIKSQY